MKKIVYLLSTLILLPGTLLAMEQGEKPIKNQRQRRPSSLGIRPHALHLFREATTPKSSPIRSTPPTPPQQEEKQELTVHDIVWNIDHNNLSHPVKIVRDTRHIKTSHEKTIGQNELTLEDFLAHDEADVKMFKNLKEALSEDAECRKSFQQSKHNKLFLQLDKGAVGAGDLSQELYEHLLAESIQNSIRELPESLDDLYTIASHARKHGKNILAKICDILRFNYTNSDALQEIEEYIRVVHTLALLRIIKDARENKSGSFSNLSLDEIEEDTERAPLNKTRRHSRQKSVTSWGAFASKE